MKNIDISCIITDGKSYEGKQVNVAGWVRTARDSKNMAFLNINDGTALKHLQIVIDKANFQDGELLSVMKNGASVSVDGVVVKAMKEGEYEINAVKIELLGDCPQDYPLQKKYHSMEFLRTIPQLRVRTNTFNAMLRVRSKLSFAIHRFFQENGFCYIHTPIITGSDCEGAGEIFRVTTNGYGDAKTLKDEAEYIANDFFKRKAGLTVSGQLEGEVAAMAMGKIYTFGPTFRAENSNTPRHAAEFWQVEPEVAFAKLPDIIEIAQSMIKYIIKAVLDECPEELAFFEKAFEEGLREKLKKVVDSDFVVLDYGEAIKILENSGEKFQYPVAWGLDLQSEHERYITEKVFNKPVFVTNYPKKIKSFYMKQNDDGLTVAATDLLVPGVGEIIGCSEREADYDKLKAAMVERNMNLDDYTGYLDLRKYGSVPHSGFGLGLERIMMYVTGIGNIRDVQLYSRTAGDLM
ncbi:MAG: asparagine--tRNA ligase [Bacteroides sp.]|nr:asparagine--tRNA ligase [Bacillota bacterium]MCM1393421.1 asparagine--tRNA ligase [[Eubacterium] siraeum]MCM1455407.1 asparagine--tRNA ligase [Bacteroides sp.]